MTNDRASVFGGDDDDLSDFKPKAPPDKAAVKAVAEEAQFRSREPQAPPAPPPAPTKREPRRYRTGRNQQLNLKVTAEAAEAFYALADDTGWVLGEVFERAIMALKLEREGKGKE